jgi:ABC-type xylose transport system permease subunit
MQLVVFGGLIGIWYADTYYLHMPPLVVIIEVTGLLIFTGMVHTVLRA